MPNQITAFLRRYRAALLDYLLGGGESALARAHALGRLALGAGVGPVAIANVHHRVLVAILESERSVQDCARSVQVSERFLLECLSPFDAACRGYLDLLGTPREACGDRS